MFYFLCIVFACTTEQHSEPTHTSKQTDAPKSIETDIDVDTLFDRSKQSALTIIDVRTPEEYAQGHIVGARNIPLSTLEGQLEALEPHKDKALYLVCAVGGRSHNARVFLSQKGFSKAINVQGGTRGWKAKGYPTE